jgi:hypothetical protein
MALYSWSLASKGMLITYHDRRIHRTIASEYLFPSDRLYCGTSLRRRGALRPAAVHAVSVFDRGVGVFVPVLRQLTRVKSDLH